MENLLDNQLKGLLLPPQQVSYSWELLVASTVLLCLFAWAVRHWYQHRNTPIEIAKRKVTLLKNKLESGLTPPKKISLQLAMYLREGLEVTRLDEFTPHKRSEWNAFQSQLDGACYSVNTQNEVSEVKALIHEALVWLTSSTHSKKLARY